MIRFLNVSCTNNYFSNLLKGKITSALQTLLTYCQSDLNTITPRLHLNNLTLFKLICIIEKDRKKIKSTGDAPMHKKLRLKNITEYFFIKFIMSG